MVQDHTEPSPGNKIVTHQRKMLPVPIIRLLVEDNPKRLGSASYRRFSYYEDGITVEQYLERGGKVADLKWDEEHHFIKLERYQYIKLV